VKVKLAAVILGSTLAMGLGVVSVAADTSVAVDSGTTVGSGSTSTSLCASQSTLVQVNGSAVVDRNDSSCTP